MHCLGELTLPLLSFAEVVAGGQPSRMKLCSPDKELSHGSCDENLIIGVRKEKQKVLGVKACHRSDHTSDSVGSWGLAESVREISVYQVITAGSGTNIRPEPRVNLCQKGFLTSRTQDKYIIFVNLASAFSLAAPNQRVVYSFQFSFRDFLIYSKDYSVKGGADPNFDLVPG